MAENLTDDNYNDLCRLCASKTNVLIGLNIFEGEGNVREINKKIATLLPVQVHETDRLPKMICNECVYKLDLFFTFREKSIETECILIELVKKLPHHIHQHTSIEKRKSPSLHLVPRMDVQQMNIAPNPDGLLGHPNISLVHDIAIRDNLLTNDEMILSTHANISMHNHDLENIEIAPNELNTHENLHNHLDLHHESEMAHLVQQNMQISDTQLSVENLDMIPQHNLIPNYDSIPEKHIDESSLDNREMLTLKDQEGLMTVKIEHIKTETQGETETNKAAYSDPSETDESSDTEFDSNLDTSAGENMKNEVMVSSLYEREKHGNESVGISETIDEKTQLSCTLCGKISTDKDEYLSHYGEHLNECLICHEAFANLEALKAHQKEIHSRRPQNRKSHKSIKSRARLKDESTENIDDNFFKDESSDEEKSNEFMPGDDEDEEEEAGDGEKRRKWQPKVCKECGKHYKTNYKLAEHMRKHTGEQPFKCSMCDKAFRSKIGLAQHEAKHTGQFDFACPTCGKGFQCRSYLIVHQRVHSDLKPYPCTTCGRNFKTKQSLLDHMNRHLGVKPFMCEICGRSFITKGLCKSHQKVHSGTDNRQYPCTVCNKLFVSKSYLATHVRIHTGEKPFMCEVCGKGFLTRVDLRIHSTMHTGEKSFVCEMCGKAFARRDALRCHRRSHTGERPYSCDICGQTFTQFSPMAIHKRLHTGERPYSCEVCKKTFVSRSTMMSHRKKHTP